MSFVPRSAEELAAEWPAELDHVSASSLKQFARCPEQWRIVRMVGRRQRPAGAVLQGKADHGAIATHFAKQITDGVGLTADEVREVFAEQFERELDLSGGAGEVDWGKETDAKKEAAKTKDKGTALAGQYRTEVAQFVVPKSVEEKFELQTDVPMRIDGYIDAVVDYRHPLSDVIYERDVIIERKTAGRKQASPEWRLQAAIYQLVKPVAVDFHISVKSGFMAWGTPDLRVEPARMERTQQLVTQLVRLIGTYYITYGPDHPWPGNITHPWACNYCGFRDGCHWWS